MTGTTVTGPRTGTEYPQSGTYNDGALQINNTTLTASQQNPDSKLQETLDKAGWVSVLSADLLPIQQAWCDWAGAASTQQYLENHPYKVMLDKGTYAPAKRDQVLDTKWSQIQTAVKTYSWRAIYAKNDGAIQGPPDQQMIKQATPTATRTAWPGAKSRRPCAGRPSRPRQPPPNNTNPAGPFPREGAFFGEKEVKVKYEKERSFLLIPGADAILLPGPGGSACRRRWRRRRKDAVEMTRLMGNGINLGNTMEACDNSQPVTTPEMLQGMKACGFDTIRIPVAWMTNATHLAQGDYTISPEYMDRVEEIVNYALDAGMIVIINDHWDGGWWGMFGSESEAARNLAMEAYTGMWKQLAERFGKYDWRLVFESANEELGARFDENSPLYCDDSLAHICRTTSATP